MTKECPACTLRNDVLFESKHWVVILNSAQSYLGRSLITSKRHVENLSVLTSDEWIDLQSAIKKTEKILKKAFPKITLFNWSCLMNHAFKEKPYNPHVHWHVMPRYDKPIVFAGLTWKDPNFGNHYIPYSKNIIDSEKLQKMYNHILKFVK